jgi:hypothetical protein
MRPLQETQKDKAKSSKATYLRLRENDDSYLWA